MKGMGRGKRSLKELAEEFGNQEEYRMLFKEAQLGRVYHRELEQEVVRLCLALDLGAEEPVLRSIMAVAGAEDLQKLKTALQERFELMYPPQTQLPGAASVCETVESEYLI